MRVYITLTQPDVTRYVKLDTDIDPFTAALRRKSQLHNAQRIMVHNWGVYLKLNNGNEYNLQFDDKQQALLQTFDERRLSNQRSRCLASMLRQWPLGYHFEALSMSLNFTRVHSPTTTAR